FRERVDALNPVFGLAQRAVGGEDTAAEWHSAARDLSTDATVADNAQGRAVNFAVWRSALDPARAPRGAFTELAGDLEQPVMQRQHRHDHIFRDRGFVAERIADPDAGWQRGEVEQLDPRRNGLDQADL